MTFVWHFLEACTGFIHYMFSLAYFPNLVWRNLAKNRTKEKSFTLSPMASNLKLLPVFWCEHVWNNIISRAICWWLLMHVFTFSVRHYKPRTCYKKSGSRCGTNRQGHHAEPTNNSCCFGVYSKGDCRCHKRSFCWKSRTCAWNVLVWHSFMAAVRRRHFWILLLWFVLVLQKQCAVFGMNLT